MVAEALSGKAVEFTVLTKTGHTTKIGRVIEVSGEEPHYVLSILEFNGGRIYYRLASNIVLLAEKNSVVVSRDGLTRYYIRDNAFHRTDGPAVLQSNPTTWRKNEYYIDGFLCQDKEMFFTLLEGKDAEEAIFDVKTFENE